MSGIKSGIVRARKLGGTPNNAALTQYFVQNGYGTAIYAGDPVRASSGRIKLGSNSTNPIGVVEGFAWINDTTKEPTESKYFPASTSSAPGRLYGLNMANGVIAFVADDPKEVFIMRSEASIAITAGVNNYARVTLAGNGSAITGRSNARVDASGTAVSATNRMFRIIGIANTLGQNTSAGQAPAEVGNNDWGQPNAYYLVMFSDHAYDQV